jgi:hypothetical protein
MTTQSFLKGLMMAVIAVVVAGFSTTPIDYLLMGLAAVSTILVYTGKNLIAVLHSDSPAGSLSLVNLISGVLVALGSGLLDAGAIFITGGTIVWLALGKVTLSILFTYLGTTWFAPPYSAKKIALFGNGK